MTAAHLVTVDARALERVLALLEDEERVDENLVDDDSDLRAAVDSLSGELEAYRDANPSYDEEDPDGPDPSLLDT
tara:strand:- start:2503 stop:2727 length:225 start_codon:yes stop_codon:yes gene_type:complete